MYMEAPLQPDGFCYVEDVLKLVRQVEKIDCTFDDLERVVRTCPKQRFELQLDLDKQKQHLVRATQGHSMTDVEDAP